MILANALAGCPTVPDGILTSLIFVDTTDEVRRGRKGGWKLRGTERAEFSSDKEVAKRKLFCAVVLCLTAGSYAVAQQFSFPELVGRDPAARSRPCGLAQRTDGYKDGDRDTYMDNLFRLQMVAHDYARALESISELRTLRRRSSGNVRLSGSQTFRQLLLIESGSGCVSHPDLHHPRFQMYRRS